MAVKNSLHLLRSFFSCLFPRDFRRFLFSLAMIGIVTSKAVHIYENLLFEPLSLQFMLFFPTVWLKDIPIILLIYLALYPASRRIHFNSNPRRRHTGSAFGLFLVVILEILRVLFRIAFGFLLPLIIFITSTSELSFYLKSGQLVMWSLFRAFMKDPAGNAIIFSGGSNTLYRSIFFQLALARLEPFIMRRPLACLGYNTPPGSPSRYTFDRGHKYRASDVEKQSVMIVERDITNRFNKPRSYQTRGSVPTLRNTQGSLKIKSLPAIALSIYAAAFLLSFMRPIRKFDIMLTSIPLSLMEIFDDHKGKSSSGEFCGAGDKSLGSGLLDFPYPNLVSWNKHDKFPEVDALSRWLPSPPPVGFERFDSENNSQWKRWGKMVRENWQKIRAGDTEDETLLPPKGYHHAFDPLKISNHQEDLISELRNPHPPANDYRDASPLKEVKIRNIVMLTLESTRSHVFPFREDSAFVRSSMEQRKQNVGYWNITDLTPNAEKLVGKEYGKGGSGGIFIEGAQTGASYTRKSFAISHCGVSPLAIDWYEEKNADIYQPCLPHIFKLLNDKPKPKGADPEDWRNSDWLVQYAQSVTFNWDKAILQMDQMGFNRDELVYSDFLEAENATHPLDKNEKLLNAFGYREPVIKPYMRDHIKRSVKENKRFFLSHLTSATHAPWMVPTKAMGWLNKLFTDNDSRNRYFNTVGYIDRWIGEIFDMLEEEGVRDETLVVITGDHGIAIGEGSPSDIARWSPTSNTHVNTFRIPIIFHHPKMPNIHLPMNATNLSILPTILDLLTQTDSLGDNEDPHSFSRAKILESLIPAYEGQSLLRPFHHSSPLGLQNFNFGVVNPGSTRLVVTPSDPANPYRLTMPLCDKVQYGVSNVHEDPEEVDPLRRWTTEELANDAGKRWGPAAKAWTEKAVVLSRWWIREGRRRWHYQGEAKHRSPKFENQFKKQERLKQERLAHEN